jgi:hypothetical protein
MQILFAISVLCFAGILWAVLALARHIKASQVRSAISPSQRDFKDHLFSTIPRIVPEDFLPASRVARQSVLNQSVHDIAANKEWALPAQAIHMDRLMGRTTEPVAASVSTMRKPPLPARHGRMELLDPAYFNKDMGDLTDPQPNNVRVNDRTRSNSSKRY